jgi:hypothetical protein
VEPGTCNETSRSRRAALPKRIKRHGAGKPGVPATAASGGLAGEHSNPDLAGRGFHPTVPSVIGFLRFVGLLNAAIWLGAAVFFTFGAGPAVFSEDMKALLGPKNYPYFSGAIAQVLIARFFTVQLVCGAIAAVHLSVEWLYLGRPMRGFTGYLLIGLLVLGLAGDLGMQPKIKRLHTAKYAMNATPQSRATAARSLAIWHGVAQGVNLFILGGLVVYLWRVANPSDAPRFVPAVKLRS